MNKNKFVLAGTTLLIVSLALTGCTDSSTTQTSDNKEAKSVTQQPEKIDSTSNSTPGAVPILPESPSLAPEQPIPSTTNVVPETQTVEVPAAPSAQSTSNYGDPSSCPPGSTLVNDIPQLPPMCSVPISSDFVEVGRPPADAPATLFQ